MSNVGMKEHVHVIAVLRFFACKPSPKLNVATDRQRDRQTDRTDC